MAFGIFPGVFFSRGSFPICVSLSPDGSLPLRSPMRPTGSKPSASSSASEGRTPSLTQGATFGQWKGNHQNDKLTRRGPGAKRGARLSDAEPWCIRWFLGRWKGRGGKYKRMGTGAVQATAPTGASGTPICRVSSRVCLEAILLLRIATHSRVRISV